MIEGKIFKHGTAEELADDEQVRKLYLGRNFELKRKDYLYEEARAQSIEGIEKSTLVYIQDYLYLTEELQHLFGHDLDQRIKKSEFFTYSQKVVKIIKEYGETKAVPELTQYAIDIEDLQLDEKLYSGHFLTEWAEGTSTGLERYQHESKFKEELQKSRVLLEKIHSIIGKPETETVITK